MKTHYHGKRYYDRVAAMKPIGVWWPASDLAAIFPTHVQKSRLANMRTLCAIGLALTQITDRGVEYALLAHRSYASAGIPLENPKRKCLCCGVWFQPFDRRSNWMCNLCRNKTAGLE